MTRTALLALAMTCAAKKKAGPSVSVEDAWLHPAPAAVARLSVESAARTWRGPARLAVKSADPLHWEVEDFDQAGLYEVRMESTAPPRFAQVPGAATPDEGLAVTEGRRTTVTLRRQDAAHGPMKLAIAADLAPVAAPPPADWLRPGTTLYYGLTFDNLPVTKVVPMGLVVRLGAGSDGSRVLTWKVEKDPFRETEITSERVVSGRTLVPPAVVEKGTRLSDRFGRGESVPEASSLFLSRAGYAALESMGGTAFHDDEVGPAGVLVRVGPRTAVVQADDALWAIPVVVATAAGGKGVYAVAADAKEPLVVSAVRPGYRMKLMAIGRPDAAGP